MLQRSFWSRWLLSAAVSTASLVAGTSYAQSAAAPAASAPAEPAADSKLVSQADDFLHYSLVNNVELAKANADALLAANAAPDQLLRAFEEAANGRDYREIMLQDQRRDALKEAAANLLAKVDEGSRAVARDPVRIRTEIDRLAGGPRAYQLARERLAAAGPYAVPLMLEYLQNNNKKDLHRYILQAMGEIGRPLLLPLVEELRVSDPGLRVSLVTVVGQIGYPQALPALRAMQADANLPPETRKAVDDAIARIDRTGRAAKMPAAELYVAGGENFYGGKSSYQPLFPEEKTNPVWYFDQNLNNVMPQQVPTVVWADVMAMRSAESALQQDSGNAQAVSLWLAADLRREIRLPAGATDPSRGANTQDAVFYARAAGPAYVNPVLGRALDNADAALALRAIDALEATGGVSGLVSSSDAPLVRALAHSDRSVRFHAAFALARANPTSQYPSFYRVVPILAEALSTTGAPTALIVEPQDNVRNALTDSLRNSDSHYTVYSAPTLSAALEKARGAAAFDVVIIPSGNDVAQIGTLGRTDYRLSGVPVLITAKDSEAPGLRVQFAGNRGYGIIDATADASAVDSAVKTAQQSLGISPVSAESASEFALTSLKLLDTIAADHRSIYSASEALPALVAALKDKRPEVATASAGVIGKLNSPDGQRALATAALVEDTDAALRIVFFTQLAESAKRTSNSLDAGAVDRIIKLVGSDADAKLRLAAAGALGALNVPANQASTLILKQAR